MKRSVSPDAEPSTDGRGSSHPKRRQRGDVRQVPPNASAALLTLAENADELIAQLQALKQHHAELKDSSSGSNILDIHRRFANIGEDVVASLQTLATPGNAASPASNSGLPEDRTLSRLNSAIRKASISAPSKVQPWKLAYVPKQLPTLPRVQDPIIEETAFTHPGVSQDKHYERLEWLGDAYLELISTILISQTFTQLPSGRCAQIRERLIRNTTLASFFRQYGLESRAKLPSDVHRFQGKGRSNDKDITKIHADMFEAYTAAVIVADPINGLDNVTDWLRDLWSMHIVDDLRKLELSEAKETKKEQKAAESGTNGSSTEEGNKKSLSPKEELAAMIVVKGVWLRYEKMECTKKDKNLGLPLFAVGAYLDGWGEQHKLLGLGTALNVKEAGHKAATEAMQNRKLMKIYVAKKKEYMELKEAEAAALENGNGDNSAPAL